MYCHIRIWLEPIEIMYSSSACFSKNKSKAWFCSDGMRIGFVRSMIGLMCAIYFHYLPSYLRPTNDVYLLVVCGMY